MSKDKFRRSALGFAIRRNAIFKRFSICKAYRKRSGYECLDYMKKKNSQVNPLDRQDTSKVHFIIVIFSKCSGNIMLTYVVSLFCAPPAS